MSKLIPLRWTGALMDSSGYASASRSYIGSLLDSGKIDLTLSAVSFEQEKINHGKLQDNCIRLLNREGVPYKIHIIHLTPENYPSIIERGKYNIAYTVWETDVLPDGWVRLCNQMDEIWVPSEWNKSIFESCGVDKPICVIPHGIKVNTSTGIQHMSMGVNKDTFVFYSIFQWIERKNPLGLLKAYLTEFAPDENVCLSLKTYRINTTAKEKNIIKQDIANIKKGLNLKKYPQVRLFGDLLTSEQMAGFHLRGDCFVLVHRAEGFGIPHAEAMAYGKPVIATRYGGNLEFMTDENSYLVNCQETPVCNMIFPNYHGHMTWADPNIMHLRKLMRQVFTDRNRAKLIGMKAKKDIEENYNWAEISNQIIKRLREIQKEIG